MSKERLEEIKYELYTLHNCTETDEAIRDFIFNHLKIEWLIEQVERVEVLEKREEVRKLGAEANSKYYRKIEQQNKRYREALEFYAKGNHYHAEGYPNTRLITNDYGDVARKALESDSDE